MYRVRVIGSGWVAASNKKQITYPTRLGSNCLEIADNLDNKKITLKTILTPHYLHGLEIFQGHGLGCNF